jgi:GH35 family endo-1,4-beta-xylanase
MILSFIHSQWEGCHMQDYSHRKGKICIKLLSADGIPLANTRIAAKQQTHAFLFGCGGFEAVELNAGYIGKTQLEDEKRAYYETLLGKIFSVCNYATLPFYWGRYEPTQGQVRQEETLAAARWFNERGIITKGHPLCWHTVCAPWLLQYDNSEIISLQKQRIDRDVSAFKGLIDRWDVINEVVIMPIFDKYDNAITRMCNELGQVGIVKTVFDAARQANPSATLVLNDFNVSPAYEDLIDRCLDAGVPIGVIGIQSHQHQGYWGLEKLQDVLARFSRFGLPIHFTENTIISGALMPSHIEDLNDWQVEEWPTTPEYEQRQAQQIVEIYETLFAHPLVEAVTTWDSTDGKWLKAPSGLLRADLSEKPVFTELDKRINHDWRTDVEAVTDDNGFVEIEGFKGTYKLTTDTGKVATFEIDGVHGDVKGIKVGD